MSYAPKTLLIAAAFAGLAGCAVDPLSDNVAGGGDGAPVFAESMSPQEKANVIVRVADSTVKRGDLSTAVALYRRALSVDSKNFEAATGLARTLSRLGAHDAAADAWRVALKLQPNNTEALRGMGNTLVASGRPELAVQHYERALSINPEPLLYNSMGVANDMMRNYKMAQAYYRVGLKTAPKNLSLRNNLGLSLLLAGKSDQAVIELRKAIGYKGAGIQHRMNLALALVESGDSNAALSIARMDLGPREANQQIAYFETIHAMGDSPAAREAIRAHILGKPDKHPNDETIRPVARMVESR